MSDHNRRAEHILQEMRIEEKIAQLCSIWLVIEEGTVSVRSLSGVTQEASAVDPFERMAHGIGEITRPLGSAPVDPVEGVRAVNRIQQFLVNNTRLGIPAIPHEECLTGVMAEGATIFPSSLNLGSLWDPSLVEEIGAAIGNELRSIGGRQGLAPVLDVCRDARWGRTEECYGEDPYLVGMLGSAYVRGLQGSDGRVMATLKHYAGHSFSEGGRNHAPVRLGERELADTFLLPFEMVIRLARAASVMPAYHDIDGIPLHESYHYLTELLRDRWGFDGLIVADYEGIAQLCNDHRTQEDMAGAAAAALSAGVDMELPGDTAYREGIRRAVDRGSLDISAVNAAVKRVLAQKIRIGLFESPYTREESINLNPPAHREIARRTAAESMVLLKNDGMLPLSPEQNVAVIGPLSDDPLSMLNGYSFPVHLIAAGGEAGCSPLKTVVEEISSRSRGIVSHARGCDIISERPKDAPVFPGEIGVDGTAQRSAVSEDTSGIAAAVEVARAADRVVLMVGDLSGLFLTGTVGEGSDTTSLELPGVQMQLMEAILDTGTPTAVVVSSGRPYHLGRGFSEAAAVVQAWLPGQEGAAAIADVLYGEMNPGGKLPVSIPISAGALPYFYNHKFKSPGTPIQPEFGAAYPFGFGLSYTQFRLSEVNVAPQRVASEGELTVDCRVQNIGERTGSEVVQVYVRDLYASLTRPVMELKAFQRVTIRPGSEQHVQLTIPTDLLSFTDRSGSRVVEPGEFAIMVGTSSRDIVHHERVTVTGRRRELAADWRMTSSTRVAECPVETPSTR
jgi:beta-glucosidase